MKDFFKKSNVFAEFQKEQEREEKEDLVCKDTQVELHQLKEKFETLSKDYENLQQKYAKQKFEAQ